MAPTQDSSEQDPPELTGNHSREVPHDFSLVLGGPLFQLLRKSHLSGENLEHLNRRVVAISLVAWFPLLLIASASKAGLVLFLQDVEAHARLLVALPILIAGELVVHSWTRSAVGAFVKRHLILPNDLPRFDKAIESAVRLLNSTVAQVALLMLVYTVGLWLWENRVPIPTVTWYGMPGGRWHLTPAGYWYVFVSIPIVQFLLLGWYLRFFVWCRFLWQVSKIKLNLISTHPDHRAGLAFLGRSAYAFGPILFAQGAMLAGIVASRVLYRGEALMSFRLQIGGFVAFFVSVILGPLLMFSPQMAEAKKKGLARYGQLGQTYVEDFERKWDDQSPTPSSDLLGTSDIQTLADLSHSYSIVSSMRMVPFSLSDITRLAATTAAPFLPLLLTIFSVEDLLIRLIKVIF